MSTKKKEKKKRVDIATSRDAGHRSLRRCIGEKNCVPKGRNWVDRLSERYLQRAITRIRRVSCAMLCLRATNRGARYLRPEIRMRSRVRKTSGMCAYCDPARRFAKKGGSGRRVSERMRDRKNQRRDYNTISRRECTSYLSSTLFLFFFPSCCVRNTSGSHYRSLIGIIMQRDAE